MIKEYLTLIQNKGFSPSTIKSNTGMLLKYSDWLWNNKEKKVSEALEDDLEEYILYLKKSFAPGTVRLALSCVRKLYRFAHRQGYILRDPTLNLLPLRKESLPKDIPSQSEVECLLNRPDEHTYHGIRDKAILELLYSSGLRNQEVRDLKISDIDLKESLVRVICGKGGKGRVVPIGKKATQMLTVYLKVTRPKYARSLQEDHLFLTERGSALKEWSVNGILYLYRKKSNLTKCISPHKLRHACALHMLRGGAPIDSIRQMLGHKHLTTTQIYTRLYPEDLKKAHQKYHPREKINSPIDNMYL